MKHHDLKSLSVDQLWTLHEEVIALLTKKMIAERAQLERQLRQLNVGVGSNDYRASRIGRTRRPYPQVFPKYRNPKQPSETWAGRGKQPRWLTAQLESGKKLEEFRIQAPSDRAGSPARQLPRKQGLRRSAS